MSCKRVLLSIVIAGPLLACVLSVGCRSGNAAGQRAETRAAHRSQSQDLFDPDQPGGMAADDADRFRAPRAERPTARRPRDLGDSRRLQFRSRGRP